MHGQTPAPVAGRFMRFVALDVIHTKWCEVDLVHPQSWLHNLLLVTPLPLTWNTQKGLADSSYLPSHQLAWNGTDPLFKTNKYSLSTVCALPWKRRLEGNADPILINPCLLYCGGSLGLVGNHFWRGQQPPLWGQQ